ncbi:MAG: efflux RND transporter permease subunit [Saprospiraceae bacterium]|nr:efflux RND transporter permease subunit [Saprospiraceae bacterium]
MNSPFRIVFIFFTLVCLGIASIPYLDIDLLPKSKSNNLSIQYQLPGASPTTVESRVTQIIENAVSGISGLHKMSSVSRYDRGQVDLELDKGVDLIMARFELAAILRRVYPTLPPGVSYPTVEASSGADQNKVTSDRPILVYTITAADPAFVIKSSSEEIFRKELAGINEIKEIKLSGSEALQVCIQFDILRCHAYGVEPQTLITALHNQYHITYPGMYKESTGHEYFITVAAPNPRVEDLEKLVLTTGHTSLRLKDVAKIFIEPSPVLAYYRVNGQNSINLMLYAREGSNKLVLADVLKSRIKELAHLLPVGYDLRLSQDDTTFLREEINKNYRRSLAALSILILFLLLSYRSWRYLFVLLISLFFNLALTALMCYFLQIPVHLYSIAGLAISFGIMIDNSIVTLDYFHQYKSRHIFLAVLGATLTTIAALLLVFLLPDELKNNLTDFAAMVSIALAVSLVVSLWGTPALYRLFYAAPAMEQDTVKMVYPWSRREIRYHRIISFIARFRKSFIVLSILLFGLPVFLLPANWNGHPWYNKTLGSEWYLEHLRPTVNRLLGGSLRLFVQDVYEKSGYRDPQRTRLYVSAQMKYGTTIQQMNTILSQFEAYLVGVEGIDQYITNIYSGQYGFIDISFTKPYENSSLPWQLKSRLTAKATDWSAVEWGIYGVGQGFSTYNNEQIPSFKVLMKGYNNEELEKQTEVIKTKLLQHPRIQKVNTNERLDWSERASWEYILTLNEVTMAAKGITKERLYAAIKDLSQVQPAGANITIDHTIYPVVMREKGADLYDLWDLRHKPMHLDSNASFNLHELGVINLQSTASALHKEDRQYIRLVAFEYLGSEHFGSIYLDKVLKEMQLQLPLGYTAERQTWRWGGGSKSKPYWLLLLMILAIFFICALLFENLKYPWYIILLIPISFTGLFLTFAWGDFYFDQGGYAAFVMLSGLVVNAAIFIVHDFQQAVKTTIIHDYNRLLIQVVSNRARTIFLTTLSAICGLLPFIWEGQQEVFWFSLAVGVIGGLVFSMYAVFVVLVVLLWKRNGASEKFKLV